MNRLCFAIMSIMVLSSCWKEKPVDKRVEIINSYVGEYGIMTMDWQAYGERGVSAVDLDGDGYRTNELTRELSKFNCSPQWMVSRFISMGDGKTGRLMVMIPVMDYYRDGSSPDGILLPSSFSVNPASFFLDVSVNEDCTNIVSTKFDHLDWPDEDRISMSAFGGVQISEAIAEWERIYLTVDHYMVYDFHTSKLIDGYMKIWLLKE